MMRNSKCNLVPYEVIERAITGDTAALLAVQERHKAYIGRLSGGNADMKERLNGSLVNWDAAGEVWGICSDASGNCDYHTDS